MTMTSQKQNGSHGIDGQGSTYPIMLFGMGWLLIAFAALCLLFCNDKGTNIHSPLPPMPTDPEPANYASNQGVVAQLRWQHKSISPDDSIFYNVYFSTDPEPALAASGLTANAFSPNKLQYATRYYWKVQVCDKYGGKTMGPLWSFTTSLTNQAPYAATFPTPPHNSFNQPLDILLAWQCSDPDGDSLNYDLYFGTKLFSPLIAANLDQPFYMINALQEHSSYFWKVVARDDYGHETQSLIWMFTTLHIIDHIEQVGFYECDNSFSAICVSDNHAYVAGYTAYSMVLDISNLEEPTRISGLGGLNTCLDLFVSGNYAYLAGWGNLNIVDIADPMNPNTVGRLSDVGCAVYVQGQNAFCCCDGIEVIDISDPSHPILRGAYRSTTTGSRLEVQGN